MFYVVATARVIFTAQISLDLRKILSMFGLVQFWVNVSIR